MVINRSGRTQTCNFRYIRTDLCQLSYTPIVCLEFDLVRLAETIERSMNCTRKWKARIESAMIYTLEPQFTER